MPERCPVCGAVKPEPKNLERDAFIRQGYKEGLSLEHLSRQYYLGEQRIKQIIGTDNLKEDDKHAYEKYRARYRERDAQVYDLYFNDERSITELATKYVLSRARIHQIIAKELRRRRRPSP